MSLGCSVFTRLMSAKAKNAIQINLKNTDKKDGNSYHIKSIKNPLFLLLGLFGM